jgi:hypothetical protein
MVSSILSRCSRFRRDATGIARFDGAGKRGQHDCRNSWLRPGTFKVLRRATGHVVASRSVAAHPLAMSSGLLFARQTGPNRRKRRFAKRMWSSWPADKATGRKKCTRMPESCGVAGEENRKMSPAPLCGQLQSEVTKVWNPVHARWSCCKNLLQMAVTLCCNSPAKRRNRAMHPRYLRHKSQSLLNFRLHSSSQVSCGCPAAVSTVGCCKAAPAPHGQSVCQPREIIGVQLPLALLLRVARALNVNQASGKRKPTLASVEA